jgi:hypothetical protein
MPYNRFGKLVKKTRKSYSVAFKIAMIERARIDGKKPVSLEASIHISTIHEWFHQEKELRLMVTIADRNGRKPTINKEVENTLMEWFDNLKKWRQMMDQ